MPVPLRKTGKGTAFTELMLYRGRLQLGTIDAMYSDGNKYMPAIVVRTHFAAILPQVKKVLVLGGGMASIVHVLNGAGYSPQYTLVEANKTILKWAMEFTPVSLISCIEPVCADAAAYMATNAQKYDLIFIDVFNGRTVPPFVVSVPFLQQCKQALTANGHLALNYIVNDVSDWQKAVANVSSVFPQHTVADKGENKIFLI